MGKAKKDRARLRRAARQRADPITGQPPPGGGSGSLDALASPAQRQQLLETLTTGTPSQKAIACHAIAHLLSSTPPSPTATSPFLHPHLLARLLSLLFIPDFDTRHAAAIALHSLSSLGQRACTTLLKHDTLNAALALLTNPSALQLDGERRGRLLVEGVGVLRDLIENVDSVLLEVSSSSSAIHCLFSLLSSPQSIPALQVEVASLLLQATEDNERLVSLIRATPSAVAPLTQLLSSESAPLLLRLNVAGVVLNMQPQQQLALLTSSTPASSSSSSSSSSGPAAASADVQSAVQRVLLVLQSASQTDVAALTLSHLRAVHSERLRVNERLTAMEHADKPEQSTAAADHDEGKEAVMGDDAVDYMEVEREERKEDRKEAPPRAGKKAGSAQDVERESQRKVEQMTAEWSEHIHAVKLAVELLSNLTAPDDDDDDGADEEEGKAEEKELSTTSALAQALVELDVFGLVVRLLTTGLPLEEVEKSGGEQAMVTAMMGDDYAADVLSSLSSLRSRSAALLTNLILCLPFPALAHHLPAVLQYASHRMRQLLLPSTSNPASASGDSTAAATAGSELEEMESLTGLYFVLSKAAASSSSSSSLSSPLSPEHVQPLLDILAQPSTPLTVQLNLIDLLPLLPSSSAPNACLCAALLYALQQSPPSLERTDRVLNALMDVYAEDGRWGEVLVGARVLERMEEAVKGMERAVKGMGGRGEREERRRYVESARNVRAFLQYKPQHL